MSLTRSTLLVMTSRVLVLFAGLIVALVAAHSLSTVEQGYFFTFISLAAAQTLFELGITSLIIHYISHARAGLAAARDEATLKATRNEALAARSYVKHYFLRAACLFTITIGISGAVFFAMSRQAHDVSWALPWSVMVAASAIGLYNLNFFSYIEGFGRLNTSYRVRIQSTALLIVSFVIFVQIFQGLLSYPAALLVANAYSFLILRKASQGIDRDFGIAGLATSQRLEIGKEQRRMGVSAIAGYITANSLSPYAFHFFGAVAAGQLGLTMSIFGAIATIAMARTTAEAPTYGPLIATGELGELKSRFQSTLIFSAAFATLLCFSALGLLELGLAQFPQYTERLLDTTGFIVISVLIVANVTLSVTGTVLRAFKTELLMWPSLAAALIVIAAQLAMRLDPVVCIGLLAVFNGLVFYPYAQHLLLGKISRQAA